MPASTPELLAKANAAALRFVDTELETGPTLARMAERACDADKKDRYRHYARLACKSASGRFEMTRGTTEQLREINLKMADLRKMLGPNEEL